MKKILLMGVISAIVFGAVTAIPFVGSVTAQAAVSGQPTVEAVSAYEMEASTGSVLFAKNETERKPIASMAKIMTLTLIFDELDAGNIAKTDLISVSTNSAGMGGSQAFLDAGSSYSVNDLIQSIVIASANDSCVAMAEKISGSVEGFVSRMNDKAAALGMADTNFVNCTGLPAVNHYSCARDVALMSKALFNHPSYYEYSGVWMYDLTHPGGRKTGLTNTNRLIRTLDGCDGGKTGFTNEAGFCISATAKRDDMRLISVVMGEKTSKTRFEDASKLINYGFANYEVAKVATKGDIRGEVSVKGGKESGVSAEVSETLSVFSAKSDKSELTLKEEWVENLKAPLTKGDAVGKLYVLRNGVVVGECSLVAVQDVKEKTLGDAWHDIISRF